MGQFMQWVGAQAMGSGTTNILTGSGVQLAEAVTKLLKPVNLSPRKSSTPPTSPADAWSGPVATAKVELEPVALPAQRTTVTGVQAPAADAQTIRPDAKLLFVAGAGGPRNRPTDSLILGKRRRLFSVSSPKPKPRSAAPNRSSITAAKTKPCLQFMTTPTRSARPA